MNRKDFFKTSFLGILGAMVCPSALKAKTQTKKRIMDRPDHYLYIGPSPTQGALYLNLTTSEWYNFKNNTWEKI